MRRPNAEKQRKQGSGKTFAGFYSASFAVDRVTGGHDGYFMSETCAMKWLAPRDFRKERIALKGAVIGRSPAL
jgi:hypothetical protein